MIKIKKYSIFLIIAVVVNLVCSCGKEDYSNDDNSHPDNSITVDSIFIVAGADGLNQTYTFQNVNESSNISYTSPAAWCKANIVDSDLKLRVDPNLSSSVRYMEIKCINDKIEKHIFVSQNARMDINQPVDKADFVSRRSASFSWSEIENISSVKYVFSLGFNENNLKIIDTVSSNVYYLKDILNSQTKYYWQVSAISDGQEVAKTIVYSFETGQMLYKEKEVVMLEKNREGRAPSFVIVGDGFVSSDYEEGGSFDKACDRAIYGIFKAEPFASYRSYFNVYAVVAYSVDRGVTIEGVQNKRTVFSTILRNGTNETNYATVQNYAAMVKDIESMRDVVIIVIANENRYCGTTTFKMSGDANISIVGYSDQPNTSFYKKLENLVCHEACGHGFGRLCDEYVSGGSNFTTLNQDLINMHSNGFFQNVSNTNDITKVPWSHFIGRAGYEAVGVYEGGNTMPTGFWRSENNSGMNNNAFYFNAISREQIVKRIKDIVGETYSIDEFISHDKVKSEPLNSGVVSFL